MNIQENLEWTFAQPLAFWLSAVALAIVANLATSAIRSSYARTLTLSKSIRVSYYCRLLLNMNEYIKSGNISYVLRTTETLIILYSIIICMLTVIFIGDKLDTKSGNAEIVGYIILLILTTMSVYGLSIHLFQRISLINVFYAFAVIKKYEPTHDGYIDFIAEHTETSRGDVVRIFQKVQAN